MNMREIDGSYGEGGGSIARVAVGLSIVTGMPIHIYNIRKNRPQPGLKTQHLQGIRAAAELCNGKLEGAELGSTEIKFFPGNDFSEKIKVNIETAGSIGLVLQVLQIASVFAPHSIKVEIKGGATYGTWSPPIDFIERVTYKILEKFGYKIDLKIEKHGFYPKGGARVSAVFEPNKNLSSLNLVEQGKIRSIEGISVASKSLEEKRVAERQKISARQEIFNKLKVSSDIKTEYFETECPGSGIVLSLTTNTNAILGAASIGEKNLRAEIVGKNAAESLANDYLAGGCIDHRTLDQIIPFIALTQNPSVIRFPKLSNHSKTNIWVCEQFFGKIFKIEGNVLEKLVT